MGDQQVAFRADHSVFVRIYIAAIIHPMAYGISFLLPLRMGEIGGDEAYVGRVLAVGTVSALAFGLFAGHLSDRFGRIWPIVSAALAQAIALAIAATMADADWLGILVGLGFGFGWAIFYLLTPIFTVSIAPGDQRVKFLTIVSGLMMLGIGIGPMLARFLLSTGISTSGVFAVACGLSGVCAIIFVSLVATERALQANTTIPIASLTLGTIWAVLGTSAARPILMIAVGGCIFGCLTNFQTAIASDIGVDFSLFFAVFVTTVVLGRLTLAGKINSQPAYPAACMLLTAMCGALTVYALVPLDSWGFVATTILFGFGYGLAYSVLNGIVANTEKSELLQSALLVFPLAYLLGLYGFPFVGGWLIVTAGVPTLMSVLLLLGLAELMLAVSGLIAVRRRHL